MDFWFDFASSYSYITSQRIEPLARAAGVPLRWRPFLLGPIFRAQLGSTDSPFNRNPVRGRYMWRDLERLCARHGIPWKKPTAFPRNGLLAARVSCVAPDAPWIPGFCRAVFRANFAEDREIADPGTLAEVLRGLGVDEEALLARAASPENKARLRRETEEAEQLGIFGAPNFVVDGELFFGDDRLEEALEWASAQLGAG